MQVTEYSNQQLFTETPLTSIMDRVATTHLATILTFNHKNEATKACARLVAIASFPGSPRFSYCKQQKLCGGLGTRLWLLYRPTTDYKLELINGFWERDLNRWKTGPYTCMCSILVAQRASSCMVSSLERISWGNLLDRKSQRGSSSQ